MKVELVPADSVDDATARQLAVLLGRAFTDVRHTERYSEEQRSELMESVVRVHEAPPNPGELMPKGYLDNFPSLRNLARPPGERRRCDHFVARAEGYLATHVALFAQHFRFEGLEAAGAYIEDVATDPLHLEQHLATSAMAAAVNRARELELDLVGLATGIQGFYHRLGWRDWEGGHTFQVVDFGLSYPDEPLMLYPLTPVGEAMASRAGQMMSWRLWRFGERPAVS